jgi:hypothetical protein
MLRTINQVSPARRAAIDVLRANVPMASRGIIDNHQPCRARSDSLRAHTQGRTFDSGWHGALSDSRQVM